MISCCGLIGFGAFQMFRGGMAMVGSVVGCTMNFTLAQAALKAYAEDNGGKLPPAATWQDALKPYHDRLIGKMGPEMAKIKQSGFMDFTPASMDKPLECSFGEPTTTVTFNSDIGGKLLKDVKPATIAFFESTDAKRNAHAPYKERPAKESPKIMGSPRDWLTFPVEGDPDLFSSSNSNMDMNIDWKDAMPAPPTAPEPPKAAAPAAP